MSEKSDVKVPEEIRKGWEETRLCANLIREGKAKLCQTGLGPLSGIDDLLHSLLKIRIILYRLRSQDQRWHIHGVGVVGIFYIVQRLDEIRMTNSKTNTHACHGNGIC